MSHSEPHRNAKISSWWLNLNSTRSASRMNRMNTQSNWAYGSTSDSKPAETHKGPANRRFRCWECKIAREGRESIRIPITIGMLLGSLINGTRSEPLGNCGEKMTNTRMVG